MATTLAPVRNRVRMELGGEQRVTSRRLYRRVFYPLGWRAPEDDPTYGGEAWGGTDYGAAAIDPELVVDTTELDAALEEAATANLVQLDEALAGQTLTDADIMALLTPMATEADLDAAMAAEAGRELAYAERLANDTTQNITASNVALMAALLPGLSITVVGTGRPVDVEFQSRVRHSVVAGFVSSVLMVNGDGLGAMSQWWTRTSPTTGGAVSVYGKRRLLLAQGVSYTFEVAKQLGSAGTGTWEGAAYWPTILAATQR